MISLWLVVCDNYQYPYYLKYTNGNWAASVFSQKIVCRIVEMETIELWTRKSVISKPSNILWPTELTTLDQFLVLVLTPNS